jgi:hypothetical protein
MRVNIDKQAFILSLNPYGKKSLTGIIERKTIEIIQKMCKEFIVFTMSTLHQIFCTKYFYSSFERLPYWSLSPKKYKTLNFIGRK